MRDTQTEAELRLALSLLPFLSWAALRGIPRLRALHGNSWGDTFTSSSLPLPGGPGTSDLLRGNASQSLTHVRIAGEL